MGITVPSSREQTVRQAPVSDVKQTANVPDAAFGTLNAQATQNLGKTLGDVGDTLNKRALVMQEERNKAKALEAEQALVNWQIDYLHNPQTGAYLKRGANALDITRETLKQYQTKLSETAVTLENDRQRELFTKRSMDNQGTLLEQVSKFERDELYNYSKDARKATAATYQAGAQANATNPAAMEQYLQKMAATMAEDTSTPKEVIDLTVNMERSKNILTGIQSNIDRGDYQGGINLYNAYKDKIVGKDADTAKLIASKATQTLETQSVAKLLVDTSGTQAEAVQAVRAMEDAKGKDWADEATTQVKKLYGEKELMINKDRSEGIRQSWDAIAAGSGTEVIPVWADTNTRKAMQKAIVDKASGKETVTDPTTMATLKKSYLAKPGEFATMDLSPYMNKLNDTDRKQVLKWQAESAAGISDAQMKAIQKTQLTDAKVQSEGKAVLTQAMGNKWFHNKNNADTRDQFLDRLDREVQLEAERQGKEGLSRDEVNGIAQKLLLDGRVSDGHWWWRDSSKKLFQVPEEEIAKFYVPYDKIPEAETLKIRQAIKANNQAMVKSGQRDRIIPETREGVERVFNAQKFKRETYKPGLTE